MRRDRLPAHLSFLLDALPGRVAILRRVRDVPLPDGEGDRGAYDADEILGRMRDDDESDWPHRLIDALARVREPREELSEGELRVLTCASHGLELAHTADVLGISRETAKSQLAAARRRLGAKNTCHACCLAIRAGVIV